MYTKTKELIGERSLQKLRQSKICVVGIGGVGGYAAEMLARSGVSSCDNGELLLIDFDKIEKSNINRQIIALNSTLGQEKVEVMKNRIKDINPDCNVITLNKMLSVENIEALNLKKFDFVVDAIDMLTPKIRLIEYCYKNSIKIVSATGSGNRFCLPHYEIKDIFETSGDGLARKMRQLLRKLKIENHSVAVCANLPQVKSQNPASISFHPPVCGAVLAAYVINQLINTN